MIISVGIILTSLDVYPANASNTRERPERTTAKTLISVRIIILNQHNRARSNNVKSRKARKVRIKYKIKSLKDIPTIKETLKQKVLLKAQPTHRYEKRIKFFRQNKIFQTDEKEFYQEIAQKKINVNTVPTKDQIKEFLGDIWNRKKEFNTDAAWVDEMEKRNKTMQEQQ